MGAYSGGIEHRASADLDDVYGGHSGQCVGLYVGDKAASPLRRYVHVDILLAFTYFDLNARRPVRNLFEGAFSAD